MRDSIALARYVFGGRLGRESFGAHFKYGSKRAGPPATRRAPSHFDSQSSGAKPANASAASRLRLCKPVPRSESE